MPLTSCRPVGKDWLRGLPFTFFTLVLSTVTLLTDLVDEDSPLTLLEDFALRNMISLSVSFSFFLFLSLSLSLSVSLSLPVSVRGACRLLELTSAELS
jgi:hypothetical protein